ncbi:hypothetical protein [Streptomyces fradiae]|uniref:hypothetical protein n=1 Tax=Streptomyces fradiae TaxID=1906 RepID=UPI00294339E5|nr:hypothetical protein [Streptomyces fradiae]WOI63502.1 hypothetical protein RYQ63_28520 [Streptomyces fradiae]
MSVTPGEEVMLPSLADESGVARDRAPAAWAVAGGTLLERAVLHGARLGDRTSPLITLLPGAGLHGIAFSGVPRKEVEPRTAAVAEGQWAADGGRRPIREIQATTAAVTAATIAACT